MTFAKYSSMRRTNCSCVWNRAETKMSGDARDRIIRTACITFASAGYKHTTIRTISKEADVNTASINYYFRSKRNLYLAAINRLQADILAKYAFELKHSSISTGAECLEAYIRKLLVCIFDKGAGETLSRIVALEMLHPSEAFDEIMKNIINPHLVFLSAMIRRFLNKSVPDENVTLCCISILGQILCFSINRQEIYKMLCQERFQSKEIERFASHVTRFSLYALEGMASDEEGE